MSDDVNSSHEIERLRIIKQCADELVKKIEQVHNSSAYNTVFEFAHSRLGQYDGPSYTSELRILKGALEAPAGEENSSPGNALTMSQVVQGGFFEMHRQMWVARRDLEEARERHRHQVSSLHRDFQIACNRFNLYRMLLDKKLREDNENGVNQDLLDYIDNLDDKVEKEHPYFNEASEEQLGDVS